MRLFLLVHIIMFLFYNLKAQYHPEFGEVSEEELTMVSFKEDPGADIVILFDRAQIEIDNDYNMILKRETRIKILSEEGKDNASIRIPYLYEDKIWDIEAYSYLPNGETFEFDDDDILEEQIKNIKFKKFDIPGVEVGSVIEYRYTLFSEHIWNLEPWYFQSSAYTKLSQVSFFLPTGFIYSTTNYNWINYDIKVSKELALKNNTSATLFKWTARNIPPIKEEPYMAVKRDYYAKVLFQLVSFKNSYTSLNFARSWNEITKNISDYYENILDETGDHNSFIKEYLKKEKTAISRATKIYEYVRDNIITEYTEDKNMEDVFNDKKGNIQQKNYLLLNLLKNEGFEVYPFMISTRSHGVVYENWPNLDQFDLVISCVKIDKKIYYLDVNNKYCPFGYLVPNLDVGRGLKIMGKESIFSNMKSEKFKNEANLNTIVSINDDGSLAAESNIEYNGYLAVRERSLLKNQNIEEHVNSKLEDYDVQAKIDTFYYENLDSLNKPVNLTIRYKLIDAVDLSDNLIYMTIPCMTGRKNNPYTRETRNFPVDYTYTFKLKEDLVVNFPENFTLIEKPKDKVKRLDKFNYSKVLFKGDTALKCRRIFEIGKRRFNVSEYQNLKKAYDKIVESDQAILVLEKKDIEQ